MAIVYQGDAGLNAGISQAGGALAQALGQIAQQRQMQSQFKNINEKIKDKPFTTTLLSEILAEPGGMAYLQQFGPIIAPILKEQAKAQGAQGYMSNVLGSLFPDMFGGPGQPSQGNPAGPEIQQMNQGPQPSPIQQADIIQRGAVPNPRGGQVSSVAEARSAQSNVPDISGVPSRPPVADSNRVGPQEQTVYQQGGQAGMGINPPQEGGDAVRQQIGAAARAEPNMTPAQGKPSGPSSLDSLTPDQRRKAALLLAGSPYSEHRELAKILNDQAKEDRVEERDIRQESRAEIAKYAEPFRDLSSIDSSVSKLEKAKDLIKNRKVSLDENQFRRFATAVLEDEDYASLAQYFKSDEQKMLFALLKDYFKTKDIGGSNPSTKEVLLSLSTLPSENMGKEANLALINELIKDAKGRQIKGQKINELRSSGKQYNFGEFQKQVEDTVREGVKPLEEQFSKDLVQAQYAKQIGNKKPNAGFVWAVDQNGQLGQIPKKNIKKFTDAGGVIINGN